ncbi:AAA family ATPase [Streptomyces sp. 6N223]|uniref:AAA family ATPase n=1 Tax=Streptomyces sp. 6N223 TaxID=3457412 RepID=UPI003FD31CA8
MFLWPNGTFGVGKTTTAQEVVSRVPDARLFDAEKVGEMLGHVLGAPEGDFQNLPPWRGLVVETARQILDHAGGTLVIAQTVLREPYWREIRLGLTKAGIPVRHFVLHADHDTLVHRIETDTKPDIVPGSPWRLGHLAAYQQALQRLRQEATVIDTTHIPPTRAAGHVLDHAR